jgi:hypothetical protein
MILHELAKAIYCDHTPDARIQNNGNRKQMALIAPKIEQQGNRAAD